MDRDMEKFCKTCHGCHIVSLPDRPEPMKSTELPKRAMTGLSSGSSGSFTFWRLHLCLCGLLHSRFYEIDLMKTVTADRVIQGLVKMFTTHGLPATLTCDNSLQFASEEFKDYLRQNGIVQRRVTGISPAELLYGHKFRTKIPELNYEVMDEEVRDRDREKKEKSKIYTDARRNARECNLMPGDRVLLKLKKNKVSTNFALEPYEVTGREGNSVAIQSPAGIRYKRNTTNVRKYYTLHLCKRRNHHRQHLLLW